MEKYVYLFQEGNKDMKNLLGGKGANLAEMTNIGMPVPSGFTVTTEACNKYYDDGKVLSEEVISQIKEALSKLEEKSGKKFGDKTNPLLVSVRSGARASMPGMMDTVLNLGLNARKSCTPRAPISTTSWTTGRCRSPTISSGTPSTRHSICRPRATARSPTLPATRRWRRWPRRSNGDGSRDRRAC